MSEAAELELLRGTLSELDTLIRKADDPWAISDESVRSFYLQVIDIVRDAKRVKALL